LKIYNFFQYSDSIACSGLPREEELLLIKDAGYEMVISLSMPSDSVTLENEDKTLANLGIAYYHIPVDANHPKIGDFEQFMLLMKAFENYKIFIHCTKNCRLSTFIYLYHLITENEVNEKLLNQFCSPREEWVTFRKEILKKYNIKEPNNGI